jgi:signal peptidase I
MSDIPHPKPALYKRQGGILSLSGPALLDLLQAVLDKDVPFRFTAPGTSMWPFIKNGDVITVSSYTTPLIRLGEVVAFVNPNNERLVLHRVIYIIHESYLIKGDNTPEADGWIDRKRILGRVTRVERTGIVVHFGLGFERVVIAFLSYHKWLVPILTPMRRIFHIILMRFVL